MPLGGGGDLRLSGDQALWEVRSLALILPWRCDTFFVGASLREISAASRLVSRGCKYAHLSGGGIGVAVSTAASLPAATRGRMTVAGAMFCLRRPKLHQSMPSAADAYGHYICVADGSTTCAQYGTCVTTALVNMPRRRFVAASARSRGASKHAPSPLCASAVSLVASVSTAGVWHRLCVAALASLAGLCLHRLPASSARCIYPGGMPEFDIVTLIYEMLEAYHSFASTPSLNNRVPRGGIVGMIVRSYLIKRHVTACLCGRLA